MRVYSNYVHIPNDARAYPHSSVYTFALVFLLKYIYRNCMHIRARLFTITDGNTWLRVRNLQITARRKLVSPKSIHPSKVLKRRSACSSSEIAFDFRLVLFNRLCVGICVMWAHKIKEMIDS